MNGNKAERQKPKVEQLVTMPALKKFQEGLEPWLESKLGELKGVPHEKLPTDFSTYTAQLEAYCQHCIQWLMDNEKRMDPNLNQELKDAVNDVRVQLIAHIPAEFEDKFNSIKNP